MRHKSVKDSLRHLNECYDIFYKESIKNKISEENRDEYIKLLLKNYINSDYILETKENDENN